MHLWALLHSWMPQFQHISIHDITHAVSWVASACCELGCQLHYGCTRGEMSPVVDGTLLVVGEDLVGIAYLLEGLLRARLLVHIRMVLARFLPAARQCATLTALLAESFTLQNLRLEQTSTWISLAARGLSLPLPTKENCSPCVQMHTGAVLSL